jgi:hypothetical protein
LSEGSETVAGAQHDGALCGQGGRRSVARERLDCYQHRDWKGGLGRFGEALERAPQDRPSRIFYDRCRYYQDNPPGDGWDGVWIMEQK